MRGLAVIAAVAVLSATTAASAKKPVPDRGHLVYGKKKSLWRVPVNAKGVNGKPREIAALGFPAAKITRLVASPRGDAFLVSKESDHYWVALSRDAATVASARLVCSGHATLSGDGECVLCQTDDGAISIERLVATTAKVTLEVEATLATLGGSRTDRIVAVTARGVEGISIARSDKREILAAVKPMSHLLIAPDGRRAVAVFADGEGTALYSFLFDGKGVQRKLVIEATPVSWSRDSKWLVVTKAKRGCVVRAVGGQYRCFDQHRALALAPDQEDVLLATGSARSMSLFHASLGGAHSAKPVLFLRGAQGAALWLP